MKISVREWWRLWNIGKAPELVSATCSHGALWDRETGYPLTYSDTVIVEVA